MFVMKYGMKIWDEFLGVEVVEVLIEEINLVALLPRQCPRIQGQGDGWV